MRVDFDKRTQRRYFFRSWNPQALARLIDQYRKWKLLDCWIVGLAQTVGWLKMSYLKIYEQFCKHIFHFIQNFIA